MNFVNAEPKTPVALDHETLFKGTAESTVCQYTIVDLRLNGTEMPELEGASLDLLNFPGWGPEVPEDSNGEGQ